MTSRYRCDALPTELWSLAGSRSGASGCEERNKTRVYLSNWFCPRSAWVPKCGSVTNFFVCIFLIFFLIFMGFWNFCINIIYFSNQHFLACSCDCVSALFLHDVAFVYFSLAVQLARLFEVVNWNCCLLHSGWKLHRRNWRQRDFPCDANKALRLRSTDGIWQR